MITSTMDIYYGHRTINLTQQHTKYCKFNSEAH